MVIEGSGRRVGWFVLVAFAVWLLFASAAHAQHIDCSIFEEGSWAWWVSGCWLVAKLMEGLRLLSIVVAM